MRRTFLTAMASALILATACGADEDPVPPPTEASVIGLYNLTIVNGGPLPFPYAANSTTRFDIIGGSLNLRADHTFTDLLTTRQVSLPGETTTQEETDELTGTWSLTETLLTLTYTGFGVQTAVVTGRLVTRSDQGFLMTYSK
jgi:hypothetical protein